jgi:hypothetical protein
MEANKDKKVKISTIIYAIAIVILSLLVIFAVLIYGFGMDNRLTQKAEQIFPYPAAVIGGVHFISASNLNKNLLAVQKFYENQDFGSVGLTVDFDSADGQKRLKIKEKDALTKMIENRIIEILANKKGITLTKDAIDQALAKRIAENGSQETLVDNLQRLYGWTITDFEERIVKADLYKEKLAEKIRQTESDSVEARKKIDQALADLKNKKDFGQLAQNYSNGDSAKNGGELGWFSADQMLPELAVAAFNMKKGDTSEVLESSLGFHIIQLEDTKTEDGVDKVRLRQIFVRTKTFPDWLLDQEKTMKIYIPLKGLYWNKDAGIVEFNDESLRQFEENLNQNSQDDASMLF